MNLQYAPQKGFTLAEVLITLLIIGIVASLVIPALVNDTQEAEYNVGIKKAQAELSNAIKMIQVNNGGTVNVGTDSSTAGALALRNEFCNVMACTTIDTKTNIFETNYKYYKGNDFSFISFKPDAPSAVLSNGYSLTFNSFGDCNGYMVHTCGYILVDINGKKSPNMYGKDLYGFWIIRKNGNGIYLVLPYGIPGDTYAGLPNGCAAGSDNANTSGGCTAKRLIDPEHMP